MWTLISFINVLGLCCAVSIAPSSPINASFSSVNLRNVLHWFPGNGTSHDTHFTVEYAVYGDSIETRKGRRVRWRPVRQCTDVIRTWCDLTTETWDLEHGYHARVRATRRRSFSKWAVTRRFDPKSDTTFGPPLVSLEIENNSAIIMLTGPMRYPPNNHTSELSMAAVYPHMSYNLSIRNTHCNQTLHFPVATSPYKYQLLDYNTEYCFSAKSRFLSMPAQCQASAWQCITTPQDPMIEQLQKVVVGIVVPSLCICIIMVVAYLLYNYLTGSGQKSPFMLNPPSFHPPPLILPPDNFFLIVKDDPASKPPCPEPEPHVPGPPLWSYFPQRTDAPLQPEEPLDDLSVDYGSVVHVVNREEVKERGMSCDEGGHGNSLMEDEKGVDGGNRKDEDGIYAPQATQRVTHTLRQTHMPTHAPSEMSTHVQAHPWCQVKSAFTTQPQAQLQCRHESVTDKLNVRAEGGELPQGDVAGKIDGGVEERSECENVPLLSAYAFPNVENLPICHHKTPGRVSDDYGFVDPAAAQKPEEAHLADQEENDGMIRVHWDPKTRKLVLPELEMELDRLMPSESRREGRMAGESKEMYVGRDGLKLESVYVRQTSEEEAEAQRALERGGLAGWDVDDPFKEWSLVISIDE